MEEQEAPKPTPINDDNIKIKVKKREERKILEEKKFSIKKNDEIYILTCSKTNND